MKYIGILSGSSSQLVDFFNTDLTLCFSGSVYNPSASSITVRIYSANFSEPIADVVIPSGHSIYLKDLLLEKIQSLSNSTFNYLFVKSQVGKSEELRPEVRYQ
ncbi:hypothetical protein [Sulfuracidifex metallicus]|uniref:hypothetical protein n=1 Tax=Sulfuracidifex metallicus TaxID=47303 RepID=UPI0022756FDE|nr:hypothetical protein [Sulfuracidifex metallicus]MCY0851044.1 hypothetical protein [Sulfuracidifex metallicus]